MKSVPPIIGSVPPLIAPVPPPIPNPLTGENPWPGLRAFTESESAFFFGREQESVQLLEFILRAPVTVLYGQSGLGKTSLLLAGLFPLAREKDFLPLRVRLEHGRGAAPLAQQIKTALNVEIDRAGVAAPRPAPHESLWEYFHRRDLDFWGPRNRLLKPLIVLDQFEEIFTLGNADDAAAARISEFMREFECAIEHRPPDHVRDRLERNPEEALEFRLNEQSVHWVVSLREDFLPHLDTYRTRMPSLLPNRMRLERLSAPRAIEVVERAGQRLLEAEVAHAIVDFVSASQRRRASVRPLAAREVDPALLSVVCDELNRARQKRHQARITADLLSGERDQIIQSFYERAFRDVDPRVRRWVEDELLTQSGYRDRAALEDATNLGLPPAAFDRLVNERLLHREERDGVVWLELTHDLLTDPAQRSRDDRVSRERISQAQSDLARAKKRARQSRAVAIGLSLATLFGLIGSLIAWRERAARESTLAEQKIILEEKLKLETELKHTLEKKNTGLEQDLELERLRASGNSRLALLKIAESMQAQRGNPLLVENHVRQIIQILSERNWVASASPITAVMLATNSLEFTAVDAVGEVRTWSFWRGTQLGSSWKTESPVELAAFSPDKETLAVVTSKFEVLLYDMSNGRVRARLPHTAPVNHLAFSDDGSRIAVAVGDWRDESGYAQVWHTQSGQPEGTRLVHQGRVARVAFDESGDKVVTASWDWTAGVWHVGGKLLGALRHDGWVYSATFAPPSPDRPEGLIFTSSADGFARGWVPRGLSWVVEKEINCGNAVTLASLRPPTSQRDHELLVTATVTERSVPKLQLFRFEPEKEQRSEPHVSEPVNEAVWLTGPTALHLLLRGSTTAFLYKGRQEDASRQSGMADGIGTDLFRLQHYGRITCMDWNRMILSTNSSWAKNGDFPIITGSEDGMVRAWESEKNRLLGRRFTINPGLPLLPTNGTADLCLATLARIARSTAAPHEFLQDHAALPAAVAITWPELPEPDELTRFLRETCDDAATDLNDAALRALQRAETNRAIGLLERRINYVSQLPRLGSPSAADWQSLAGAMTDLGRRQLFAGQYAQGRASLNQGLAIFERLLAIEAPPGSNASAVVSFTFESLFAGASGRCIQIADRFLPSPGLPETSRRMILMNQAHAYLFQGDFQRAEQMYRTNAAFVIGEKNFAGWVLQDFSELRAAGLPPPRADEVETFIRPLAKTL